MMRTVSLFVVILSALGGAWMILHGDFYLPNRFDLALATHFSGTAAQVLGGALLSLSAAGASFMQHMASDRDARNSRHWHLRHFVLISLTIVLFTAAFIRAEVTANPDYRRPASAGAR